MFRILEEVRNGYRIDGADVVLAGRLRHLGEIPAVGDWVDVSEGMIRAIHPRRGALKRVIGGREQILAANVDIVFLVTSANQNFNPRRLERGLVLAQEANARAAVLLNKIDLCADPSPYLEEAARLGVPVHPVSAVTGAGLESVTLETGSTIALVGSSGVGKSSLVNRWLGADLMAVRAERGDDARGRHTTTTRRLLPLAGGAWVLDMPGLREFGIGDAETADVFRDVTEIAAECRFRDCRHESEPGCAVRDCVEPDRLQSFHKLERERRFHERKKGRKERRAPLETPWSLEEW